MKNLGTIGFKPRMYAFTHEALYAMRVVRRLSMPQIARKYGCDHTTVLNALRRLGIETKLPLIGPELPEGGGWITSREKRISPAVNASPSPKVAPEVIRIEAER